MENKAVKLLCKHFEKLSLLLNSLAILSLDLVDEVSFYCASRIVFCSSRNEGENLSILSFFAAKVVSCVWRSAANLTASYLWGWEGCHGTPRRPATSTFSLTTPFSLSLSSVRNKDTEKVVRWWANILSWPRPKRRIVSITGKVLVYHLCEFSSSQTMQLFFCRCGRLPGSHRNDHVTFGCAGGATEFNVIQNNCNVSQGSKSPTKSSSKYESFLFSAFLS